MSTRLAAALIAALVSSAVADAAESKTASPAKADRTSPGRSRTLTAPRRRSPSPPTRAPGCPSTCTPTARSSSSPCWATSMCCPSRAARPSGSPPGPATTRSRAFPPTAADRVRLRPRRAPRTCGSATCDGKNARQLSTEKQEHGGLARLGAGRAVLVGGSGSPTPPRWGRSSCGCGTCAAGEGVQVTKKDDQPDAADPAFSPDGRFLFFSAREARYKYNSNVNEGIWQIKRLDRRTGQSQPLTGEFGGAAAPTLSPDGSRWRSCAACGRKTRLEVMELADRAARRWPRRHPARQPGGLREPRRLPGFAWMPDGKSLVATAGGKLCRFDAARRRAHGHPLPRRGRAARDRRAALPAEAGRRHAARPHRALARGEPDGKRLVFSAVGHLYVMDLPAARPSA